jgi:hypothetical protein
MKLTINDRINEILDDPTDAILSPRPYVEALQGVMRLHRSEMVHAFFGDKRLCCKTCHREGTKPVWPCATVHAIADAFGIETPKETR